MSSKGKQHTNHKWRRRKRRARMLFNPVVAGFLPGEFAAMDLSRSIAGPK
jgi:hypothetical protein